MTQGMNIRYKKLIFSQRQIFFRMHEFWVGALYVCINVNQHNLLMVCFIVSNRSESSKPVVVKILSLIKPTINHNKILGSQSTHSSLNILKS